MSLPTSLLKTISYAGLALSILPSLFVFQGVLSLVTYKQLMLVGTLLWVSTAPFWINRNK